MLKSKPVRHAITPDCSKWEGDKNITSKDLELQNQAKIGYNSAEDPIELGMN